MRYGSPSIESKLLELTDAGCNQIFCLPMFPQFSETTTGSIIVKLKQLSNEYTNSPEIKIIKDYSDNKNFIDALATHLSKYYDKNSDEHLVISFHGIPVSYVTKGDQYQEYCQKTVMLLTQQLNLSEDQYTLTYQSRFGPEEWLQPYTDQKIIELSKSNTKVAVFCPGFLIDCLETLDEMGNEAKKLYDEHKGPSFKFIPCLNESPQFIEAVKEIYKDKDLFESLG